MEEGREAEGTAAAAVREAAVGLAAAANESQRECQG
jgi:hypothetical protein